MNVLFSQLSRAGLLGVFVLVAAQAQPPLLHYRSIVNTASRMPAGLPGGGIARGSTFSISGSRIGPATSPAPADPPETTLGGVSIVISQGSATVAATPVMVSANRVDAIVPSNAPLGLSSIRLTYNGARSNPMPVQIVSAQFGINSTNGLGLGPSTAQVLADDGTLTPITLQTPVIPGQNIVISGTGLGGVPAGAVSVFVGGSAATVVQVGPVAGSPGQDQIELNVPADAPLGCWTPIYVKTSATAVSNVVTTSISGDGSPCGESNNPLANALINGGNVGAYATTRMTVRHDAGVATPREVITDRLDFYQANEVAGPANFNPIFSLPPPGSCTAYTFPGDPLDPSVSLPGIGPPTGMALDAGAVTVTGSAGTGTAQPDPNPGYQSGQLGVSIPTLPLSNKLFLDGGLTLNVAGGADIGGSSTDAVAPVPLTWANRDQVSSITRSKGLTFTWTGGVPAATYSSSGSSYVFLLGYAVDMPTNSGAAFVCVAPPDAGTFTVPAEILANFPATRARAIQSRGAVYLGQGNPQAVITTGLDVSGLLAIYASGKTVNFQ